MNSQTSKAETSSWRWRLPSSVPESPWFWIPLFSAISFLLSIRLFRLPMVSDEGGYAYAAQRWFDGRGDLYHDVWISRPQAIFVIYGAVIEFLGGSTLDLRLVAWVCNVLTMIVIWTIASRWRGNKTAIGATILFGLLMSSPAIEGFTANAEVFMSLPAALAVLTLTIAFQREWRPGWLIATGLLAGLATQLKPSGVIMMLVAAGFILITALDQDQYERRVLKRTMWTAAGFAASLIPAVIHGIMIGWHEFLYASVTYRLTEQSTATSSLHHHAQAIWNLSARVWPIYLAIVLVAGARYLTNPARTAQPSPARRPAGTFRSQPALGIVQAGPWFDARDPYQRLLQLWIIGCLFGISMGGDWWYHYLIQIAAPLAIWLAISIGDLRERMPKDAQRFLYGAVVIALLIPYLVITRDSRAAMTSELFGHPGYADQEAVGRYLRENTDPDTSVFIAFDQAALYYLADRPSTYRYLYDQELRAFPDSQDALVAMIESDDRPEYIVGTRQLAPFDDRGVEFWEAVQRNYVLETMVRGVPIYRAIESNSGP